MDHCEETILDMLKKNSVIRKSEVFDSIKASEVDVKEAVKSLENLGYLREVDVMGEESYSITKKGLEMLE